MFRNRTEDESVSIETTNESISTTEEVVMSEAVNPIDEVLDQVLTTKTEKKVASKKAKVEKPSKKAKVEKPKGPQYPFLSKKAILNHVEEDAEFAVQCLQILNARTQERTGQKAYGFMSSHATKGTALFAKVETGLSDSEMSEVRALVNRYGKQLAAHFRAVEIASNPELAGVAKLFSAS